MYPMYPSKYPSKYPCSTLVVIIVENPLFISLSFSSWTFDLLNVIPRNESSSSSFFFTITYVLSFTAFSFDNNSSNPCHETTLLISSCVWHHHDIGINTIIIPSLLHGLWQTFLLWYFRICVGKECRPSLMNSQRHWTLMRKMLKEELVLKLLYQAILFRDHLLSKDQQRSLILSHLILEDLLSVLQVVLPRLLGEYFYFQRVISFSLRRCM